MLCSLSVSSPLVAASTIRYFRPFNAFQSVTIHTRLAAFDEKWFYFEHRLTRGETLHAVALVKALVARGRRPVPTRQVLDWLGRGGEASPALPEHFSAWLASERGLIDVLKKERDLK